jgi:hypothetical protein
MPRPPGGPDLPEGPVSPPLDELPPLPPSPPGSDSPSPPDEGHKDPTEEDSGGSEIEDHEPKKDKGKGREKCVRWKDHDEFMHYYDTPDKHGEYYDIYHDWTPKEPKPPKNVECLHGVAKVAVERMKKKIKAKGKAKGVKPADNWDEETNRFIDGFEHQGESSTAWKKFKKFQESPKEAIGEEFGPDNIRDPDKRATIRKEVQVEIDTINRKLESGEWIKKQFFNGKGMMIVDAYLRIDELEQSLEYFDSLSQYVKRSGPVHEVGGFGKGKRPIVWVA